MAINKNEHTKMKNKIVKIIDTSTAKERNTKYYQSDKNGKNGKNGKNNSIRNKNNSSKHDMILILI